MRLPGATQTEDLKTTRKLLKPQVEKQRRERMNRSLETLRVLLLEDSQHQGKISRRIEKAEILEETVLFLKKSGGTGSKVGEQQQVQDGISACLQRAARFLHGRGAALQVDAALKSKFFHWRVCAGAKAPAVARCPPVDSTQQSAQTWHRRVAFRSRGPLHHRALACGDPNVPQRPQRDSPRSSRSPPVSQVVWRPWP
ncbi:hairy and enhancer of split related-7 [Brienomyrus brachyistius]|uniref:hairy and enhancer of split related-7 n=1 Tax=Brienomyrus brachyistius TaxID=42636 RepID=UPI0020B19B3A|nr:hairy and enhancer of split related-7 [Brienomyrus brachyistius]